MTGRAAGASGAGEGRVERLSAHVWRVALPVDTLPPHDHTNAYLIASNGRGMIVDPGSGTSEALGFLDLALQEAGVAEVELIALTHTHPDHVDGVGALLGRMSSPLLGVHHLESGRLAGGWPRLELDDGYEIALGTILIRCLHTPGHSPGHLALLVNPGAGPEAVLAGDLVADEGSVWVGLPEGDMSAYLASLERIANSGAELVAPGHGPVLSSPRQRIAEMAEHRLERERQVLGALAGASLTTWQITELVYPPLPKAVLEFAEKSIAAHLVKLLNEGRVTTSGSGAATTYSLA